MFVYRRQTQQKDEKAELWGTRLLMIGTIFNVQKAKCSQKKNSTYKY
jgi:hypothetical protein